MYNYGRRNFKCKTLNVIRGLNGKIVKNSDGTVNLFYDGVESRELNNKSCCELLGYKFNIDTQKCYWSEVPANDCSDCTTKVVYNSKNNDGSIFNVNETETCNLEISLDYILNFDCDLFGKVCVDDGNNKLIESLNSRINNLKNEISVKNNECAFLTNKVTEASNYFNGLCYVIKGVKTTQTKTNDTEWFIPEIIIDETIPNITPDLPITPIKPFYVDSGNTNNITINSYDIEFTNFDKTPVFYISEETNINLSSVRNIPYIPRINDDLNNIMPLGTLYNGIDFEYKNPITSFDINRFINNPPPPFAWEVDSFDGRYSNIQYIPPVNTTISGPVSYCLTENGLNLWLVVLGRVKYDNYIGSFGCDETIYTQTDFNALMSKIDEQLLNDSTLKMTDFVIETTQGVCDKKIANETLFSIVTESNKCGETLTTLNGQLTSLTNELNTLKANSNNTPISNLENLQVFLNLEVENDDKTYSSVYEESIFSIGDGNLLDFILNQSPNTGILISGVTSGGILSSPFNSSSNENKNTLVKCEFDRTEFMKELYLTQYKNKLPDPTTPEEELELNKKMNNWYNSSWLYYKKTLDDSITEVIKNKKIKITLKIENCCLDLCILTDNLKLTKTCESLDNEEIIISEPPKFEIERVMDNKKSWVSYTGTTSREYDLQFRETQYNVDDYRLTINTKEIDLKIDGANAIEEDVLCIIDCLLSASTEVTVSGTCCEEKCNKVYVTDLNSVSKSFNGGKDSINRTNGYIIGYQIKKPLYKDLDTYTPTNNEEDYYKNLVRQGIWVPIYPKINVSTWLPDSVINSIMGSTSCDSEDYAATNRTFRDSAIKAKNQLSLSTSPFEWANLFMPQFQIEKYYLKRDCSITDFRVGDAGPGGYVAYVDETGQHGLIFAYYNGNNYWHSTDSGLVNANNDGLYSGITNTSMIVSAYGSESNVAKYCSDYTTTGNDGTIYNDYYLPSKFELNLISENWKEIGISLPDTTSYVWSSTENDTSTAWAQNIYDGTQAIYNKSTLLNYIVVRNF